MSVFRNIRVLPTHGDRAAVVTWSLRSDVPPGDVYVAFSPTGLPASWVVQGDRVPSELGFFLDSALVLNSAAETGYYQLLLKNSQGDNLSERIGIIGDLSSMEYGMVRGIIHREFTEMRATNGYPVWHCIPKSSGPLAPNVDPDTMQVTSPECSNSVTPSYGLPYLGGFHKPLLTWMRPGIVKRGTRKDPPDGYGWQESDTTAARLLPYPTPSCEHMIIDPATDRRYLVGQEIAPFLLRGIMPVVYDVTLHALSLSDARYKFNPPVIDLKAYRRLPYWTLIPSSNFS